LAGLGDLLKGCVDGGAVLIEGLIEEGEDVLIDGYVEAVAVGY